MIAGAKFLMSPAMLKDAKWHIHNHLISLTTAYPSLDSKTAMFTHNDGRSVNLFQADDTIPTCFMASPTTFSSSSGSWSPIPAAAGPHPPPTLTPIIIEQVDRKELIVNQHLNVLAKKENQHLNVEHNW
ncbi:hypothetical protein PRUPE_2G048300 [Prunus persica]|uniref:Uncharacterized protein n=1 Tax=Prunus persica TaxID=3760 RepID=A0A251QB81_PRUPE|nr:hypothetical protein PRUPE_2G048300 [Prunus persica]